MFPVMVSKSNLVFKRGMMLKKREPFKVRENPLYRKRMVPSKKIYSRKIKHPKGENDV